MPTKWHGRYRERLWREKCWDEHMLRREVEELLPESDSILDIGCGTGQMRNYVGDLDYTGLDWEEDLNPDIVADSTNIPLEDDSFGITLMKNHLQHVEEYPLVIEEAKRIAQDAVIIFANCHNKPTEVVDVRHGGIPLIRFNTGELVSRLEGVDIHGVSDINPRMRMLVKLIE